MSSIDVKSGMTVLDREASLRRLADEPVGRVAVIDHGRPYVVPVNYTLDGDGIFFRTADGSKLAAALSGPVCFEVDHFDAGLRSGWSVIVHGRATQITRFSAPDAVERVMALPLDSWSDHGKPHVVRISCDTVTGRELGQVSDPRSWPVDPGCSS